jgi:putative Holliday junction resolvase
MAAKKSILALDVGDRRVGVALADSQIKIAVPYGYLERSDKIIQQITELMLDHDIDTLVIGYPRNQSGEATKQTESVEQFAKELAEVEIDADLVFQDESLSSVEAERRLGRVKDKGEIDAEAASIILQDYLEQNYAD